MMEIECLSMSVAERSEILCALSSSISDDLQSLTYSHTLAVMSVVVACNGW
jgi:hypothetical protein